MIEVGEVREEESQRSQQPSSSTINPTSDIFGEFQEGCDPNQSKTEDCISEIENSDFDFGEEDDAEWFNMMIQDEDLTVDEDIFEDTMEDWFNNLMKEEVNHEDNSMIDTKGFPNLDFVQI